MYLKGFGPTRVCRDWSREERVTNSKRGALSGGGPSRYEAQMDVPVQPSAPRPGLYIHPWAFCSGRRTESRLLEPPSPPFVTVALGQMTKRLALPPFA
jgi:hypothetical protein